MNKRAYIDGYLHKEAISSALVTKAFRKAMRKGISKERAREFLYRTAKWSKSRTNRVLAKSQKLVDEPSIRIKEQLSDGRLIPSRDNVKDYLRAWKGLVGPKYKQKAPFVDLYKGVDPGAYFSLDRTGSIISTPSWPVVAHEAGHMADRALKSQRTGVMNFRETEKGLKQVIEEVAAWRRGRQLLRRTPKWEGAPKKFKKLLDDTQDATLETYRNQDLAKILMERFAPDVMKS